MSELYLRGNQFYIDFRDAQGFRHHTPSKLFPEPKTPLPFLLDKLYRKASLPCDTCQRWHNSSFFAQELTFTYKQLWTLESIFSSAKSLQETRPIYHTGDDTIREHVFCSFLALMLRNELETRLEARGEKLQCAEIKRDLRALQEVEVELVGSKVYLRTDLRGICHEVVQAAGVAEPKTVRF